MTRAPMLITDDPFVRQELACPEARSSNTGPYREIYLYGDGSVVEYDAGPRSQDDESMPSDTTSSESGGLHAVC